MLYFIITRWAYINKEIVKFLFYFNKVSYGSSLHTYVIDDTCLSFGFKDDFGNRISHLSYVLSIFIKFIFIVYDFASRIAFFSILL